ncbi:MAG: tRNA (5-methylaminomethyl-2-thiouridine)(34)-methyltransferase MnmD [Bacteroidales bacterium]
MNTTSIISTDDGSFSVRNEMFNEAYHSHSGAILESNHVFIEAGFRQVKQNEVSIFELGFGTGLNALLTLLEAQKTRQKIYYEAIELYPLAAELSSQLNYSSILRIDNQIFENICSAKWNTTVEITPNFTLCKKQCSLLDFRFIRKFDLVYFDAFSADTQAELWTESVFFDIYNAMNNNAVLTTYSSKGLVKRNLRAAGFIVQRLQGAGGKHHMLRAIKREISLLV